MKPYRASALFILALICMIFWRNDGHSEEARITTEMSMSTGQAESHWTAWLSGHDVSQHEIFGIKVYIISRLGKLLLFIAGLSIVLDILGERGLRQIGESIGAESLYRRTSKSFKDAWQYAVDINRATYGKLPEEEVDELSKKSFRYLFRPLTLLAAVLLFALFLWFRDWTVLSWYTILGLFGSIALAPAVVLIASPIVSVPGLGVDLLVIKPLSKILTRPNASKYLRIVMLCSLIAGSLLDIL